MDDTIPASMDSLDLHNAKARQPDTVEQDADITQPVSVKQDAKPTHVSHATLAHLPPELLRLISISLGTLDRRSLLALAQVSRSFRDIAQPLAYHTISPIPDNYHALVRTLVARPDLAARVRVLNQKSYEMRDPEYGEAENAFLQDVARGLSMDYDDEGAKLADEQAFDELVYEEDVSTHRFMMEVLLGLVPHVSVLQVLVDEWGNHEPTMFRWLAARTARIGAEAAAFTNLRRLTISTKHKLGCTITTPAFKVMLRLAPNIEELVLGRNRGMEEGIGDEAALDALLPASFPRLRRLELESCALNNDDDTSRATAVFLDGLVRRAPLLEAFAYRSRVAWLGEMWGRHYAPGQFLRSLLPARHTLRYIDVNLGDHAEHYRGGLVTRDVLAEFTALETLALDDWAFCGRWDEHPDQLDEEERTHEEERAHDGDPDGDPDANGPACLTRIVGDGIATLIVRIYLYASAWPDIFALADAAAAGRLPRLQTLKVQVWRHRLLLPRYSPEQVSRVVLERRRALTERLAGTGVQVVVTTDNVSPPPDWGACPRLGD